MRGALIIAAKDLKRGLRDRSALILTIAAPLGLAFILSSTLGNADSSSLDLRLAVVDQDGGPVARVFEEELLVPLEEQGVATVVEEESPERARAATRAGDVDAVFVLPEGLSEGLSGGAGGRLDVATHAASQIGGQVARSLAEGFATEVNATQLAIATTLTARGEPPTPQAIETLRERVAATEMPAHVTTDGVGSRQFDTKTFFAAGTAVFFLFFTAQLGAVSLLIERKEGTLTRLLAAPTRKSSVILGKALFAFVLGVGSMAVLIVATSVLLGARWGDPLGVAGLVLAGVFAAMGIQSLVTTLAQTDDQAAGYGAIVSVTLGLLGGTFFPLSQAPGFLSDLSFVTPHAWMMRGFGELSGGVAGLVDVLPALAALLLFGAVTGAAALVRARRLVVAK